MNPHKATRLQSAADEINILADMLQDVCNQIQKIKAHHADTIAEGTRKTIDHAIPSDGLLSGSIRDLRRIANRLTPPED